MRVVIVGAGEVDYHVAQRLSSEQHDVVVVDVDTERLDYVENHIDVAVIQGSGASPAVLEKAGIRKAGLLVSVTSVDEVNLVSCMSVRSLRGLVKVARVSNPDFYDEGARLQPEVFGVDVMINPKRELALEAFRLLQSTAASDIAVFAAGAVQLVGLRVTDDAPIAHRTLREVGKEVEKTWMLTVAVKRDDLTIVPTGATKIEPGDQLYIAATKGAISRALELCGYEHSTLKRVMIAGGSPEAYYLAQLLQEHRVQAMLLVRERDRAQILAEKLDNALILHGDATDVELLELEGVSGADAFVALTQNDDTNILSALLAKHAGAKQVVTLVNKIDYVKLATRIGLDAAVSPRLTAANAILRYVRRGSVTRVATFKEIEAEAIAFEVSPTSPIVNVPLAEARFPEGAILAAIVRGADAIVPRGLDRLVAGDTAIVFALPKALGPVSKFFPT